jgi:hypothetical protein
MPVELQIIRAAEFIRLNSHGEFDLAGTCAALTSIVQACKRRGINRALVDARNARANLTPTEIAALVNVFREIGFPRELRLAVLHHTERFQRPRLFAFISRMKGWHVKAFENFEDALNWLSITTGQTEFFRRKPAAPPDQRVHVSEAGGEAKRIPIKSHSTRNHDTHSRKRIAVIHHES